MNLYEKIENVSKNQAYIMLGCGILCLILALIVICLYVKKIKSEKQIKQNGFNQKKISNLDSTIKFWKNYIYIFVAFVGIIGGIILLVVSIEYLK